MLLLSLLYCLIRRSHIIRRVLEVGAGGGCWRRPKRRGAIRTGHHSSDTLRHDDILFI